jgi:L-lactate dehydrogenase (cytochrome)
VGRPFNFAASIGGEPGVRHGIELLRTEVRRNMALLGVTRLHQLGPHYLRKMVSDTRKMVSDT